MMQIYYCDVTDVGFDANILLFYFNCRDSCKLNKKLLGLCRVLAHGKGTKCHLSCVCAWQRSNASSTCAPGMLPNNMEYGLPWVVTLGKKYAHDKLSTNYPVGQTRQAHGKLEAHNKLSSGSNCLQHTAKYPCTTDYLVGQMYLAHAKA
jgi:hypothetical protein